MNNRFRGQLEREMNEQFITQIVYDIGNADLEIVIYEGGVMDLYLKGNTDLNYGEARKFITIPMNKEYWHGKVGNKDRIGVQTEQVREEIRKVAEEKFREG